MLSKRHLSRGPLALCLVKVLVLSVVQLPLIRAAPFSVANFIHTKDDKEAPKPANDARLWLYLGVAAALVLLGGAFAGLTIALMGQVRLSYP